jgi:hypothetical protein
MGGAGACGRPDKVMPDPATGSASVDDSRTRCRRDRLEGASVERIEVGGGVVRPGRVVVLLRFPTMLGCLGVVTGGVE